MAKLVYAAIASLDGFVEDESGGFEWAAPDAEVHAYVNDLERPIGTYLYGRRMYETMVYWETAGRDDDESAVTRDYADIWRGADKVVFSRTLAAPSSARTRVEREFDPAAIDRLKQSAGSDISIGGAELAGQAFAGRLVDECHLFLCPVVVGRGNARCPTTSASGSSCWTSTASAAESSTCVTGSAPDRRTCDPKLTASVAA